MADGNIESNGTEATNGKVTAKEDSLLTALHKEWMQRTNGKLPDAKRTKELKAALQKAYDAEVAAVKAQEAARADFDKAADAALEAFGRKNVSLEGNVLLTPSSRGDRIYYKKMTHQDAI